MRFSKALSVCFLPIILFSSLNAEDKPLPKEILSVLEKAKYTHSNFGLYAKDLKTGEILYDFHSTKLFSPGSTTKLFSVAALLHDYGDDYRFKTPVYAIGNIQNGKLDGDLILVASGDLTLGGRQDGPDKIAFTKLDHSYANAIPNVILTKENPLQGLEALAKQVSESGIKEVNGDVLIDMSLFSQAEVRDVMISPIFINENLIDIIINPTNEGETALVTWRPKVPRYEIINEVKSGTEDLKIEVSGDVTGHKITLKGTIPLDQKDVIRNFAIKDPQDFAKAAFVQALESQGVKINTSKEKPILNTSLKSYKNLKPVALWTSPPLSEYAKLILKVSHNVGANLIPFLLATKQDKKTYDEGMRIIGKFLQEKVKLTPDTFVMTDAAGGNENRFTPVAEVQLLEYVSKEPTKQFQQYFNALPILGVDGSLEDFEKGTDASGKVRAKPGTGISYNLATDKFFLITQALSGYIEGKDGHLIAYMLAVENGKMDKVEDVFSYFQDEAEISKIIYDNLENGL